MSAAPPVVIGVDIGTTSTKVIAYDTTGRRAAEAEAGYRLDEPHPGEAVQDPDVVVSTVVATTRRVAADLRRSGAQVAGLSFGSAMHSLIGVDAGGRPVTPSITWADLRATAQAERLRTTPEGKALHRRTGTPVHPMSPLVKLIWLRERQPAVFEAAHRWLGIKEYVLDQLTAGGVMDRSIASGWGMADLVTGDWLPAALALAGIRPDQLPPVVPTTHRLALTPAARAQLDLGDVPVVVGAGDGPLANLGVGAVRPGVASCSIGTSGALRVVVERPGVDPNLRVFCFALTDDRWVVGGAVSNGGIVLDWARDALAPDLGAGGPEDLLRLAASAPAGSDGLLMLPYLLSERAPHWSAVASGSYIGLTRAHRRPHLVRAALEGVCQQLALVLASMGAAGHGVHEIRATGGLLRQPFVRQLLTDVLGTDIGFAPASEGSGFGAALLGMYALGLIDSLEVAADLVAIEEVRQPEPGAAAVYQRHLAIFDRLYDALAPAFLALRPPT